MSSVVLVVARWQAATGAEARVRALATSLAVASEEEPGCASFTVLESSTHPGKLVLLEEYAGDQARRRHLASPHFRRLVLEAAVPLLAVREIDAYHVIHQSPGRRDHESA